MQQLDETAIKQALHRLNDNQRAAVQQTDGPLLVIAGPGTGKTQLLSARVAYILQITDTLPQNILCLTFTESGAANMRERLSSFIGQAAYDVTIGTYHAFGGDLIGRFPQYFGAHRDLRAADALAQREIVQGIVDGLEYRNPLKSTQHHLHDLLSTISEVKRGLLGPAELRAIAEDNLAFLAEANAEIRQIFADFTNMPRKPELALPYFQNLQNYLASCDQAAYTFGGTSSGGRRIRPLAGVIKYELDQAVAAAQEGEKGKPSTKPLTAWKNQWLEKDADNNFIIGGERASQRIAALAEVVQAYQDQLEAKGLYDFDDMILHSIQALEQHQDLRYTLHEQYQYIMLDEFQDTNAAQLKLVRLLTDNPVSEGRPNVMAVGDDDQAIYAFQGAEVSNMLEFAQSYRGTSVINLTDNYRSHPEILHVAHEVAGQIGTRLEGSLRQQGIELSKILTAANKDILALSPRAHIDRHEFQADVGQYDWLAHRIADLIGQGVPAREIAVLAPRHKQLEPLVPFLNELDIPVRYEKRENILEAPVVRQLLAMSRLVLALSEGQDILADTLWPEVLSYNFWQIPVSDVWHLSWLARREADISWSQALLDPGNDVVAGEQLHKAGLLMLSLAAKANSESLEIMLDALIGNEPVTTHLPELPAVHSPLREYYMGAEAQTDGPDLFYQTLSHLTCLRQRLREYQTASDDALRLGNLLKLVHLYEEAGERMLNTSPYNQHAEAVQLMTVFKAKGLEFQHVFLPSLQDDVWGNSSRANANRLTLPSNLVPIRPAGTTEDERLRIFFVAVTRAKLGLHLTSYLQTYSGKATKRLKYLNEQAAPDGFKTMILPAEVQDVRHIEREVPTLSTLELNWRQRHYDTLGSSSLRELLTGHLENFQLSPTMLGSFSDLIYGGPQSYFFDYVLGFPHASGADAGYGNAVHETLQWLQQQTDQHKAVPARAAIMQYFDGRLQRQHLLPNVLAQLAQRGHYALEQFLAQRGSLFQRSGITLKAEQSFRNENVHIGAAHMSGKIDLMEINQAQRTITVVDYKTGGHYGRWTADAKAHKHKRQLICYKLLIEHSRSYRGYQVPAGRVEFVEPDDNGQVHSLELHFNQQDVAETRQLIQAVWRHTKELAFPDVSNYDQTLSGIRQFEADLLKMHNGENEG